MKNQTILLVTFPVMLLSTAWLLLATACSGPGTGSSEAGSIPAPESMLGTIALDDGTSAVIDIQFGSGALSVARAAGMQTVTGTVRYQGEDYVVAGLYDPGTGALDISAENATGQRFVFSGTYAPSTGFIGTVTLFAVDGTALAHGSVSAAGSTNAEKSSVRLFTGTIGESGPHGVFNGTLTADRFYGTYAVTDDEGRTVTDSFTMVRSGDSLTFSGYPSGAGTINESGSYTTVAGVYYYEPDEPGDDGGGGWWAGAEVDENHDPRSHVPSATDDFFYVSLLVVAAVRNGMEEYEASGGTTTGITGAETDFDSDGRKEMHLVFSSYSDAATGLTLSGELVVEEQDGGETQAYLDSDTTDFGDPGDDDGGLTATFPDTTTCETYLDIEVGGADGPTGPGQSATAVWEVNGVDALTVATGWALLGQ